MKIVVAILAGIVGLLSVSMILAIIYLMPASTSSEAVESLTIIPDELMIERLENGDIEISWPRVENEDATLVVQHSDTGAEGTWVDLATMNAEATSFTHHDPTTSDSALYRIYAFDDEGGSGITAPVSLAD